MTSVTRTRRLSLRRCTAALLAVVLPLLLAMDVPHAGAATTPTVSVGIDYDGTGFDPATGAKTTTTCPLAGDTGPQDGVVCTNDSFAWAWRYSVPANQSATIQFSQRLQTAGVSWDDASDRTLCQGGGSTGYTGVYSLAADGTLSCAVTFATSSTARTGFLSMKVNVGPSAPNNSSIAPPLAVSIGGIAQSPLTPPAVTVIASPLFDLSTVIQSATATTFGGVAGELYRVDVAATQSNATAANGGKGQPVLATPFSLTDDLTGMPAGTQLFVTGDCYLPALTPMPTAPTLNCTQSGKQVTINVTSADTSTPLRPFAVGYYLFVPSSSLSGAGTQVTLTNQLRGFDPADAAGQSNYGAGYEPGGQPADTCTNPANNNNCFVATYYPATGGGAVPYFSEGMKDGAGAALPPSPFGTAPYIVGAAYPNQPLQKLTTIVLGGNGAATDTLLCTKLDNSKEQFIDPSTSAWSFPGSFVIQYGTRSFASDPARAAANCGAVGDMSTDGPWFSTIAAAGGIANITEARVVSTTGLDRSTAYGARMQVRNLDPTGQHMVTAYTLLTFDGGGIQTSSASYYTTDAVVGISKGAVDLTGAPITNAIAGATNVRYKITVPVTGGTAKLTVVDPLPICMINPGLEPSSAAQWTMTVTPANYGSDSVPCTSDDTSGATLTFTSNVPLSAGASIPIYYDVDIAPFVSNGTVLTNTATVSTPFNGQAAAALSASASMTVSAVAQAGTLVTADQQNVEVAPDQVGFALQWANTSAQNGGKAQWIDVLPYNGDPRGTTFHGTLAFVSATVTRSPVGTTIEFTSAIPSTINPDPNDATNQPGGSTTWCTALGGAGCPARADQVTAIRLTASALNHGDVGTVHLVLQPAANHNADVYADDLGPGSTSAFGTIPSSGVDSTTVIGSTITGTLWSDLNRNAADNSEPGLANAVVTVRNSLGAVIATSTATGANGAYSVANLHTGSYEVAADPTSLSSRAIATYDLDGTADGDAHNVSIATAGTTVSNVSFGYFISSPSVKLTAQALLTDSNGNGTADRNETIGYSYLVKNTGDVPLSAIAVVDPLAGPVTCPVAPLAPGLSETCTGGTPHTVTQADVDFGSISTSAQVSATPTAGAAVADTSSTSISAGQVSVLTLNATATLQDANGNGAGDLGEKINYSYVLTNNGTVSLHNITITDPTAGTVTCQASTLTPTASTSCSGVYVIAQADVDAGVVATAPSAAALAPGGGGVGSAVAGTSVLLRRVAALALSASATLADVNGDGVGDVGETIAYGYTVTNSGTVTLSAVAVSDVKAGAVSCAASVLAPAASTSCTGSYVITQADVDAGAVASAPSVHAAAPGGLGAPQASASTSIATIAAAGISLSAQASLHDVNGNGAADAGESIDFSYRLTNTGALTVNNMAIADAVGGQVDCPLSSLAPAGSQLCTAHAAYTVTQADVDAGTIASTPQASAISTRGTHVSASAATATATRRSPALTLRAAASLADTNANGSGDLGESITYHYLISNTGTVTLSNLAISDALAGPVSCTSTTIAPGATASCTAQTPHQISQADVDAGSVNTTPSAAGTPPGALAIARANDTTTISTYRNAMLTLAAAATLSDTNTDALADAGDHLAFTYTLSNTGTVSLNAITITDTTAGAITCPQNTLAPASSEICTATSPYPITTADQNTGTLTTSATAHATAPTGALTSAPAATSTALTAPTPAITLDAQATLHDTNHNNTGDLGEAITYTYTLTNTGNVTLTNTAIHDTKAGTVTCQATVLAPHTNTTCTAANYTITQPDIDAGTVTTAPTTTATTPAATTTTATAATSISTGQTSGLTLNATATLQDANGNGAGDLGEKINYSYVLTNNGTVSLHNITITDPTAGTVTCQASTLTPTASTSCAAQAKYVITQADVDSGTRTTAPHAFADPPTPAAQISAASATSVSMQQTPAISITSTATLQDTNNNGLGDAGETIGLGYTVRNTGTVTLRGVAVTDSAAGTVSCGATTLAPLASTSCLAPNHPIGQTDVDAGTFTTASTATGTAPSGTDATAHGATSTPMYQKAALSLGATATLQDTNANTIGDIAETINFGYTVTNTGTQTLTGVGLIDPVAGAVTCDLTTLAPHVSTACHAADYTITQADVDNGSVQTAPHAVASVPSGGASADASTSTPTKQVLALAIVTTAQLADSNHNGFGDRDEAVGYSFEVTNNGTVTLRGVTVGDDLTGAARCRVTVLAPHASAVCTSPASHVITQADVDSGLLSDTGQATATSPGGTAVATTTGDPAATATTALLRQASLTAHAAATSTDANADGVADAGDTVTFSYSVTNTGTVTLSDLAVTDAAVGTIGCPQALLAPGATVVCTVRTPYLVTAADQAAGMASTSASVSTTDPSGAAVSTPDVSASLALSTPSIGMALQTALTLHTDANHNGAADVGDVVEFAATVTNTGVLALHGLTVTGTQAQLLRVRALLGASAQALDCPATTLAAGASVTCTVMHVVDATDARRGKIVESAHAEAIAITGVSADAVGALAQIAVLAPVVPAVPVPAAHPDRPLAVTGVAIEVLLAIAATLGIAGGLVLALSRRRAKEA